MLKERVRSSSSAKVEKVQKKVNANRTGGRSTTSVEAKKTPKPLFPYNVIERDHCESPRLAYQQIEPLLRSYASSIGKLQAMPLNNC